MAEIFLSPFLQTLFDRLGPIVQDGLRTLSSDLKDIVEPLNVHISFFRAIDLDTTHRIQERPVREWLDKLKQVAYEINDVLDEVSTEALRQQQMNTWSKVRNSSANPIRFFFKYKMSNKVKELIKEVEELAKCRNHYQLHGSGHSSVPDTERVPSQTSSSENEVFLGRYRDVSVILDLLLSEQFRLSNVDIIPILGISGVGKTALAKEVYNHKKLDKQFYQKMWVSVTESYDARQVIKSIIESSTRVACPLLDLDSMQKQLRELLNLGKYLLVIDGMWNESDDYLEKLKIPLSFGQSGSKVLITTSSRHVAKLMNTVCIHELKVLSDAECLILFNEYAFDAEHRKKCEYAYLDAICGMIVKKCKGLPLAAKAYGRLLRSETNTMQWEHIANKEIEEVCAMSNSIFKRLPANIKSCFTFCSIFPPNYQFDKMQLIQLWMALDFIADEEEGSQIFDHMFRLSLFQPGQCFVSKKKQQTFLMHDSNRSIAQTNSGEECYMMKNQEARSNISAKTRHASMLLGNQDQEINFNSLYAAKGLYTLLLFGNPLSRNTKIPDKLANSLQRLRSLDLSFTNLQELPNSVGKLKHMRYIALRDTRIRMLPESVTELYNLQTLILRNCYELIELPNCTYKLCKLRHLDLHLDDHSRCSNLTSMPPEMHKLTELRTLSRYVVSQNNGCRISELGGLPTLQGGVCLLNLEWVANANEAREAKIEDKKHIDMLELRWSHYLEEAGVEYRSVLEQLRPHINLKELRIEGYKGHTFPSWISDAQWLKSLVTLKLTHCTACHQLPQLGQLPSLKQLFLKDMDSVTAINCNLCSEGDGSTPFQALRKLQLESMWNLTEWRGGRACKLPYLRELIIIDCTKLQHLNHDCLVLEKLEIHRCPKLETMGSFPSLSTVKITGLTSTSPPVQLKTYKKVQELELSWCSDLVELPDNWLPTSLISLKIKHCPILHALPGGLKDLHCLVDFEVEDCKELGRLPEQMSCMASLERFELFYCPKISSLPSDGLPTRLQFLSVKGCPLLRSRLYEDGGEWSSITRITSVWVDGDLLWSSASHSWEASTSQC